MSVSQLLLQLVGQMLWSCIHHVDTGGCDATCYTQSYIIMHEVVACVPVVCSSDELYVW